MTTLSSKAASSVQRKVPRDELRRLTAQAQEIAGMEFNLYETGIKIGLPRTNNRDGIIFWIVMSNIAPTLTSTGKLHAGGSNAFVVSEAFKPVTDGHARYITDLYKAEQAKPDHNPLAVALLRLYCHCYIEHVGETHQGSDDGHSRQIILHLHQYFKVLKDMGENRSPDALAEHLVSLNGVLSGIESLSTSAESDDESPDIALFFESFEEQIQEVIEDTIANLEHVGQWKFESADDQ